MAVCGFMAAPSAVGSRCECRDRRLQPPLERLRGLKCTKGGRDSRKTHETYRSDRAAAIFVIRPTCVNTLLHLKRGIINNEYRRLDRRAGTFRAFCEFEGLG